MEMTPAIQEKERLFTSCCWWLKALPERLAAKASEIAINTEKIAKEDPRRVTHSVKVGLALTLVSVLYYFQPVYDNFGFTMMWAVMTVVVVFEFSVGATLGKGLNRGMATLLAGALGVGAHHLASLTGQIGEPILLGFFVFVLAAASTFVRFFPKIKARYDYGLLIFILTFSLISVSGFRDDDIALARKRLTTIIIGGLTCVIISISICPVWAGEDLHNLICRDMEKLANFLEAFGDEYFRISEVGDATAKKPFLQEYKSVLNSRSTEQSLANFARWETWHGRFQFGHPRHRRFHFRPPWQQYLKVGTLICECAYRIDTLSGYLNSDIQASQEIRSKIQERYTMMSLECGKALKELASTVRSMRQPSSADSHISNSKTAASNVESLLRSGLWKEADLLAVLSATAVASLLFDVVKCTEKIADAVHELASLAHFECVKPTVSPEQSQIGLTEPAKGAPEIECPHVVISVNGPPSAIQDDDIHRESLPLTHKQTVM